jgi:translation initiation factor 2 subunit 2
LDIDNRTEYHIGASYTTGILHQHQSNKKNMADDAPIAAEEPMFAGLKKKKTKKAVNFDEDLTLGDDVAASKTITNEDAQEAVQELLAASADDPAATKKSGSDALGNDEPVEAAADTDMFADLKKKKKKKKDIPMDLVRDA